uniref:4-oxalocrotonate tautomerase family protein n=1 Tax=Streptomyces sp. NBC_00003 TaxID=2903608 RepID=A0AAU2VGF4_9ACTN
MVKRVTGAFVDAYKIPAETVQVWIHEVPTDSWGAARSAMAHRRRAGPSARGPDGRRSAARREPSRRGGPPSP